MDPQKNIVGIKRSSSLGTDLFAIYGGVCAMGLGVGSMVGTAIGSMVGFATAAISPGIIGFGIVKMMRNMR